MIPQTLGNLLRRSARNHPHRIAIVFGRKKISYRELDEKTESVSAGLPGLGIKKGDKVAIFMDNSPEFVISYYSVLKAGAVVVPINYMFKTEEARFILQDSQAICLIASRAYLDTALELRLIADCLRHIITPVKVKDEILDFERLKPSLGKAEETNPGDLAVIMYTSGTTGHPKGAMLTHENLISNAFASSRAIKVGPKDAFICILPLFHSFAATVCMNVPLLVGAKIVLMKSLRPFKRVIRAIRKNRVTIFVAVPSIYNILKDIKLPGLLKSPLIKLINPVKLCVSGAAALDAQTFNDFEKKFRIPLLEGYGLTEASPVVTLNPLKGPRKAGSIGIPISEDVQLRLVNENNQTLMPEAVGELLVKGPNVMQGYLRQEGATKETIRDGWLYTGDMAKFDPDGYVYIVGRKKEMINVRGLNVYPREIEDVLYQNPKIKEAAVIGIMDKHKGEVPKAFVAIKDGSMATEQEIIHYLRDRLAPYKIPKYIEFRANLPKNTTGKILKRVLQDEQSKEQ